MIERIRVVAIVVDHHALLLVKGSDKYEEYWTPGGKVEKGESDISALERELKEELNVRLKSAEFFKEYVAKSPYDAEVMTRSRVYIAEIFGNVAVGNEIQDFVWMTRAEFAEGKYPLVAATREKIIPDVINAGYY